jgi:hypothetical protein
MKIDLYIWPIREQAWVLSWGLLYTMKNMGVLNRYGNIDNWTDIRNFDDLLNTSADVIMFVGYEHFRSKIPYDKMKHNRIKFVSWVYESLTDPYGAQAWDARHGKHFFKDNREFYNGFTRVRRDEDLAPFDVMDALFFADELDYERFKKLGKQSYWLPFGVDPEFFAPDGRMIAAEKNVKPPEKSRLVEKARIRYGTRYGVRSGRAKQVLQEKNALAVRSSRLLPGKRFYPHGCFVGTKSNIRAAILARLGLDIVVCQTPRKGDFGVEHTAAQHTRELAKAYNSFLISFNLRSIFSGVTPRAVESMACGRLLFQYNCPPNRPMSQNMLKNCIKYDIMTNAGLNEVREKYRHYVNHTAEAMAIGGRARAEVLQGHTLTHRVQHILRKLSQARKDKESIKATIHQRKLKEEEKKALPEEKKSGSGPTKESKSTPSS